MISKRWAGGRGTAGARTLGTVAGILAMAATMSLSVSTPLRAQADTFLRGDADKSGTRNITDAVFVLTFLFLGGPAPFCQPLADTNGDQNLNLSDPIALLGHLFLGTPEPPPLTQEEVIACGGIDPEAAARGLMEYESPDPDGNLFSCALCHAMSPDSETDIIRPGHSLFNALGRPSYKGSALGNFLGGVNVCRNDWMVTDTWTEAEPRFADLVAFMKSVETEATSPALQFEIVAPAVTGPLLPTADAEAGCKLFNRSCMICHGTGAVGTNLAPSLVDVAFDCSAFDFCLDKPDYIRGRIRLSGPNHEGSVYKAPEGFELNGTVMPFWAKDKLTDGQVEDIAAFITRARQEARDGNEPFACADDPGPPGDVLRRGAFERRFHGVGGFAEELSTRQIRLTDFTYDGGGIVVKVWLYSSSGSIRDGVAIGPDLFRPGNPYLNVTLVVDIPAEITSEMFDSVSIWCVSARQDFGSARLEPVAP
ncbi:MAG TPA: DM13 domain-containing protein [Planctomycetota bacterium]|nr:DM13 domain-containing protein [Planctomycetota bacterium]